VQLIDLEPSSPEELDRIDALIEDWLAVQSAENPSVEAVERDAESGERRWFVRVFGEEKSVYSVWFHLRQRTLHIETFVMPAPEENEAQFFEHLLRRNSKLFGLTFAVGAEEAIFLMGQVPNHTIDHAELDRLLGTAYAAVEQCFRPALRIGFASKFE
jgi:hypothetical protein